MLVLAALATSASASTNPAAGSFVEGPATILEERQSGGNIHIHLTRDAVISGTYPGVGQADQWIVIHADGTFNFHQVIAFTGAAYRELLEPLGYVELYEVVGERGEPVWFLDGDGVGASLSLREAQSAGVAPYDRYSVGLHHFAFEVASREAVDERLAWAREQGLEIENEPQEWSYVPGYYAGFFHDSDGMKLEIVYVP